MAVWKRGYAMARRAVQSHLWGVARDVVNTLANVVLAIGVAWAVAQYYAGERVARIDQTLRLMNLGPFPISYTVEDEKRHTTNMLKHFRDRYDTTKNSTMSESDARQLWDVSLYRDRVPDELAEKYATARNELNRVASVAFAYHNKIGDRELIAQAECPSMTKTTTYFAALIKIFGQPYEGKQWWQVIPIAVDEMKHDYPEFCPK